MAVEPGELSPELQTAVEQLGALVRAFEELPFPAVREMAFDLLHAVDAVHRAGLGRLVASLRARGEADLLEQAAQDPAIRTLLLLYDLAPGEEPAPVGVVVHEPAATGAPGASFIPLSAVGRRSRSRRLPVFQHVAPVSEVPPGTVRAYDVVGVPVLIANVDGQLYAVRDACPGNVAPLHLGNFTPPIIICPCHNEAYDVRTGKRADARDGQGLAVVPIAVVEGAMRIAVDTRAEPVSG